MIELGWEYRELPRANAILKSASVFLTAGLDPALSLLIGGDERHRGEFGSSRSAAR